MGDLPSNPTPLSFDLQSLGLIELNHQLRGLTEGSGEATVTCGSNAAGLASGLREPVKILANGNVGAYFGLLNHGADLELTGDAGASCGHSMVAGSILIRGHAGHSLAAFAGGGFIGVHGTAKDNCGLGLRGADIVVRQSVGARAGYAMSSGNLVLGNDVGDDLGLDATGGTIYVRGKAASISEHVREVRMREADAMRLGLLLVRAGIKAATKDFRIYRPRHKSDA